MITKLASRWGLLARMVPSVGVAVATLIGILFLGAFAAIPPIAADDDGIQRGIDAATARYQALGEYFQAQAATTSDSIQRGIDLDTFYQALGEYYQAQALDDGDSIGGRSIDAATARYQAMGQFYSDTQGPYTDVSLFYAERMRAQAHAAPRTQPSQSSDFAANPELMAARRVYRAPANELATNPELTVARRAYGQSQSQVACSVEDRNFIDDPELVLYRRASGC